MTPSDAAKILELAIDTPPEQVEARFMELRAKLEDKIAKAPTPGLKAKYRESLDGITQAFEILTLAADSSSLPVLQKLRSDGGAAQTTGSPAVAPISSPSQSVPGRPRSNPEKKKSSLEFLLVAVIAVALLGAGGWWVMKTKAENEEKARVAAEQKAEQERQVQAAREKAEQDRRDREAAEKAERERQDRLLTQLRSRAAELNVAFEAVMRAEQTAERELADLKSQERDLARELKGNATPASRKLSAQLRAQERYVEWLRETLPTHPARLARARTDELLSARAADEARAAIEAYASHLETLRAEVARSRMALVVTGRLELSSNLPGVTWKVVDAHGATMTGETPAVLNDVALGSARVTFSRPRWDDINQTVDIRRDQAAAARSEFYPATLRVTTRPVEAELTIADATRNADGSWSLDPGEYTLIARAPGFAPQQVKLQARTGLAMQQDIVLSQDYTGAAAILALQRLPEITDYTELVETANSVATLMRELGDAAGLREITNLLNSRAQRWSKPELIYHLSGVVISGVLLGEVQSVRPLVIHASQQIETLRVEPLNAVGFHQILAALHFATGDDAGTNAAIDRAVAYNRQFWTSSNLAVTQDNLNDWRRSAFDNVASTLANYGMVEPADRWRKQADTIVVNGTSFRWARNLHFHFANHYLRQRRPDDAMAAFRRGVEEEFADARKRDANALDLIRQGVNTDRVSIAVAMHYFYTAINTARLTGDDDVAQRFSQYYDQLHAAGQIELTHAQNFLEGFRNLREPAAYQAKAAQVHETQASKFNDALSAPPAAAVKALVSLWSELRTYRLSGR